MADADPKLVIRNVIFQGHFAHPLPDPLPPNPWVVPETDISIRFSPKENTFVYTKMTPCPEEEMKAMVVRMADLGLPVDELRVINMVTHYNSGIRHPDLSRCTILVSKSMTRCQHRIDALKQAFVKEKQEIVRLEVGNRHVHNNMRLYAQELEQRRKSVEEYTNKINEETKKLEKYVRQGLEMKSVSLAHGSCHILSNGQWLFLGHRCVEDVREDLAQLLALVG